MADDLTLTYYRRNQVNKLNINLTKCFGIESLCHEFDFEEGNVFAIYARNGLMKTSFAKTFQLLQQGKKDEICDKIFGHDGYASVFVDDNEIEKDQIFVIKSFESSYESDITSLLVKGTIKNQLQDVLKARTKLLKVLEKSSGLKISRVSKGKTISELEPQIISDFSFEQKSILMNLDSISEYEPDVLFDDVQYSVIFDEGAHKKILDPKFQQGIANFLSASDEIYESFEYLEKGKLTLPKLKDLKKTLDKDSFFVRENQIKLSGVDDIGDMEGINNQINEIESQIQRTPEYQEIEKLLSDVKGIALKDAIETHPEIISYLLVDNIEDLRKILWGSYITKNRALFDDLYRKYAEFSDQINRVPIDDTPWKQALDIFKKRFDVPFSMSVENLIGAIIGESVPQIKFTFQKGADQKEVNRSQLDELDTLSHGEKRALYLLNVIFDIEQLKAQGREVLIIVDDIADSFDYKNKYAIIEYLYELAKEHNFYMLIWLNHKICGI